MIELMPVASSMFDAIGHNPETNELHVRFKNGKRYLHTGFSAKDHDEFTNADSMGKHYNENIRGKFPHLLVEEQANG